MPRTELTAREMRLRGHAGRAAKAEIARREADDRVDLPRPTTVHGAPPEPLDLSREARAEWRRLVSDLGGRLRPDDAEPLAELSEICALVKQTLRECRKGQSVRGKRNAAFANLGALIRVREKLLARFLKRDRSTGAVEELRRALEEK